MSNRVKFTIHLFEINCASPQVHISQLPKYQVKRMFYCLETKNGMSKMKKATYFPT